MSHAVTPDDLHHDDHHHEPTFMERYIIPVDHKFIAQQYLLTGMAMALFGGFFAYAFRMQPPRQPHRRIIINESAAARH